MKNSVVAWDLDETLGSWVQLGLVSDCIQDRLGRQLGKEELFSLIDLFPEYVRPGVVPLLETLKSQIKSGVQTKVILFTNNNGPRSWAKNIVSYFNRRVGFSLFSEIIPAFEVNGKQVSKCRTSPGKLYSDLLACIDHPRGTKVCFIDDQEHPGMRNTHVRYLKIAPYSVSLSPRVIGRRLLGFSVQGQYMLSLIHI